MAEEGIITLRFVDTMKSQKGSLLSFVRKRVTSPEDAEDIVQDIFSRLLEGNLADTIEDLSSWLFRAARNKIIDLYRKNRKNLESISDMDVTTAAPELEWNLRFWEEFEQALLELPQEQRRVFELNELQGKTFREISEKTGENINTLLSRKRYAVLYLRERLQSLYNEINLER